MAWWLALRQSLCAHAGNAGLNLKEYINNNKQYEHLKYFVLNNI